MPIHDKSLEAFSDELVKIANNPRAGAAIGAALGLTSGLAHEIRREDSPRKHRLLRLAAQTGLGAAAGGVVGHKSDAIVNNLRESMRGSAITALDPRPSIKRLYSSAKGSILSKIRRHKKP